MFLVADKLHPFHFNIRDHTDLPRFLIEQIEYYRNLEKGKEVKVVRWLDAEEARR